MPVAGFATMLETIDVDCLVATLPILEEVRTYLDQERDGAAVARPFEGEQV